MFTKTFLYPYKQNSQSCKNLATTLQAKIIKLTNNLYKHKPTHQVINWGNSTPPEFTSLNKHTQDASNKLLSFQRFRDANLSIPPWTTDIEEAKTWLPETVFARTLLTGHSGVGIVEFTGTEQAPLYVKYIKKRHEYRIHVVKDHIIDIQQKKRKTGTNSTKEKQK